MPQRKIITPTNTINYAIALTKAMVTYRMELENALKFCIGEKENGK